MSGNKERGCLFCRTGKEVEVVQRFSMSFPDCRAIVPTRTRIRRSADAVQEDNVPLLPGYVFFEMDESQCVSGDDSDKPDAAEPDNRGQTPADAVLQRFVRENGVLKLLRYTDGDWRLHGSDDLFAEMLLRTGGNINVSQAYYDEGNRIRILSGFLKDYEGCITRVNRKTRTAEIHVDFHGKNVTMWLGYELLEAVK